MAKEDLHDNRYLGNLDHLERDGLRVYMDKVPRLQREPIHPPTPAEPVIEQTEDIEGRGAFIAATAVLIGVVIWLVIEVTHAIQTGVLL